MAFSVAHAIDALLLTTARYRETGTQIPQSVSQEHPVVQRHNPTSQFSVRLLHKPRETEQKSGQNPVHHRALAAIQECAREVMEGALAAMLFAAVAFQARLGVVGAPG